MLNGLTHPKKSKIYCHLKFQVLSHPIRNVRRNLYSPLLYMGMRNIIASIRILPWYIFQVVHRLAFGSRRDGTASYKKVETWNGYIFSSKHFWKEIFCSFCIGESLNNFQFLVVDSLSISVLLITINTKMYHTLCN